MQVISVHPQNNDTETRLVVIQTDTQTQANSPGVVHAALQAAAKDGLGAPRFNKTTQVVPVDEEGVYDEDLMLGKRTGVVGYQATLLVTAGM